MPTAQDKPKPELTPPIPPLRELVDLQVLQQIQDWFAATTGLTTRIRDDQGLPVTHTSSLTDFCRLLTSSECGVAGCLRSHEHALAALHNSDEPIRYDCHADLLQIAAPIRIHGRLMGFVVVGQSPTRPLTRKQVARIAKSAKVDEEPLWEASQKLTVWSEEAARQTAAVLRSVAYTVTELSYQGWVLRRKLEELEAVYQVAGALTEPAGLEETLDVIVKALPTALGMKACLLRLINERAGTLDIAASYELSIDYRRKGIVRLQDSLVGQTALRGEVLIVPDIATEPRFRFREEAMREGLHGMMCVGMESRGRHIGIVCVYTAGVHEFTQEEVELTQALANQAAVAIERARLIDELRAANQRLREAYEQTLAIQEQLVHSEKLAVVGELAAGIAHEVKNPLSAIMNFAGYIRDFADELATQDVQEKAQAIIDEVQRTVGIINEVRDYARPAAAYETEVVSLNDLVKEVVSFMRFDEEAKLVQLGGEYAEQAPQARVNRDKMKQVLLNLVRNAVQAVEPGQGQVMVSVGERDANALLAVTDNGHGIPREQLARIWQPFFTTKGHGGMGLGLDICRRIVTAHGGAISVDSQEGRGTTFTVSLPLVSPADDQAR